MCAPFQDVQFRFDTRLEAVQLVVGLDGRRRGNAWILIAVQEQYGDIEQIAHGQLYPAGRVQARTHQRSDGREAIGPAGSELNRTGATIAEACQIYAIGIDVLGSQYFEQQRVRHLGGLALPP